MEIEELDTETRLFLEFRDYMLSNSKFKDVLKIYSETPQDEVKFPTIIMQELNNTDYTRAKTLDRTEYASRLSYRVSIFIKPVIVDNKKYQSYEIMSELRKLIHHFFMVAGFNRDSDRRTDNIDLTVLRREMIFTANQASWNNSLYF